MTDLFTRRNHNVFFPFSATERESVDRILRDVLRPLPIIPVKDTRHTLPELKVSTFDRDEYDPRGVTQSTVNEEYDPTTYDQTVMLKHVIRRTKKRARQEDESESDETENMDEEAHLRKQNRRYNPTFSFLLERRELTVLVTCASWNRNFVRPMRPMSEPSSIKLCSNWCIISRVEAVVSWN